MINKPIKEKRVAIKVTEMVAGYGEDIILNHVNFEVNEGEIFVILGGSGCGKSTLLKHLIGLNQPISGSIVIDGVDITDYKGGSFQQVLRQCGILFQSGALFGSMTVAENVALPMQEHTDLTAAYIDNIVRMKLAQVSLTGYENHLPSEISGGMRKRAGLARAMALNPKILFFDEPSAGLDPVTSAELDQLIIRLNRSYGTTMVIVTHELPSIFAVADRVIMLDKRFKTIIAEGAPQYLCDNSQNPYVRQFFNRETEIDKDNDIL
ncbi:MAG: ATP-binding cassette domain-containing protein [Candidatus Scalindua sp.]|jgi:phospholipid/cholesterol/gamma-HCH transport system ATP-binding protein|nr:ATP-binding cassette domain-containing protein [Candidatus Scalindua sp.]MBT5306222.1 ATP-binding cassette domain-containing protein [Candidatus Scalindua sp.]MBT6048851.1 ATP-binding cassette domain-containing protein [Candidatus Scalindua sp.]MBT6562384.1 ATP-binding cassette domain-containing protein [Candidatus Scalindua sp.]MBT7209968.1 ATP-binding cassette domain-containing protein [Candidatus Scalindua sp.]